MYVSGQNLPYVQLSKANANRVEAVTVFICRLVKIERDPFHTFAAVNWMVFKSAEQCKVFFSSITHSIYCAVLEAWPSCSRPAFQTTGALTEY